MIVINMQNIGENQNFVAIERDLADNGGTLRDAWVIRNDVKWYPVIVGLKGRRLEEAREASVGFEINKYGKRGKNSIIKRDRVNLEKLFFVVREGSLPNGASIKCSPEVGKKTRDARLLRDLEYSPRFGAVLAQIAGITSLSSSNPKDVLGEAVQHSQDGSSSPQGQGREEDPQVRLAIEKYAVGLAKQYYQGRGYDVDERGKPYDLHCEKQGELLHVEVKGSRSLLDAVVVTINEVTDARDPAWRSDLYVVDAIELQRGAEGDLICSGGRQRVLPGWYPEDARLKPTQYRYSLPVSGFVSVASEHVDVEVS